MRFVNQLYYLPSVCRAISNAATSPKDYGHCIVENLEWCNRSYNIKYSYDNNNRRAMMNWRKGASNANAKPIIQLSKESKFIKRFGCIMDAERETGILNSSIVSCLKGHQKTAGGYKWEYVI